MSNKALNPIAKSVLFYQKDTIERNMHNFSVTDLDQLIENTLKENKDTSKVMNGYKLLHDLMNDPKFYEEVTTSALSSTKRKYKNLKIKMTTAEYQLNFN